MPTNEFSNNLQNRGEMTCYAVKINYCKRQLNFSSLSSRASEPARLPSAPGELAKETCWLQPPTTFTLSSHSFANASALVYEDRDSQEQETGGTRGGESAPEMLGRPEKVDLCSGCKMNICVPRTFILRHRMQGAIYKCSLNIPETDWPVIYRLQH